VGGGIKAVCCVGTTGVVPVGAVVDATLFGGLGSDGKNDSFAPFGKTVPFVGNVGDPVKKKIFELEKCDHLRHHV
jgi:hypothetical protein